MIVNGIYEEIKLYLLSALRKHKDCMKGGTVVVASEYLLISLHV